MMQPRNQAINIQAVPVSLSSIKNTFYLGINFFHFFDIYCQNVTSLSALHNILERKIKELRELKVEPVFVFSGISYVYLDYIIFYFEEESIKIFQKLNVRCVQAISTTNAQLASMFKNKIVNAIMTNYSVILNDVTHWVHFIDFENSQFIVLKSNPQILNDLISEHTLPDITAPSIENQRLYWRVLPPLFGKKIPQIPINTLSLVNIGIIKKPRLAIPQVRIPNNLCLPKNCINNLNRCSGIYFSYLQNLTNLSFNRVLSSPDSPPSNDFLLFLLNQSRSKDVPCIQFEESTGEHRFFDILSLQNISSKNFTTLLNCLQSISGPPEIKDVQITKKMILQESIRKFLAAHEYIAPGGGLSPWGRAVLVANSENDDPTILFIELIRAEIIDVNLSSQSNGSVGITDIIERTFSLFQIKTEIPEELEKNSKLGNFEITSGLIYSSIRALLHMIVCGTYLYYTKEPSVSELMDIINDAPFKSFKPLKTGTLMRFLLESSEETVCEFLDKWEIPRKQLKKDVLSAVKWWGNINRATEELKQRSLRPNSRVSNLKNFLVLFECANQFVEKRSAKVLKYL